MNQNNSFRWVRSDHVSFVYFGVVYSDDPFVILACQCRLDDFDSYCNPKRMCNATRHKGTSVAWNNLEETIEDGWPPHLVERIKKRFRDQQERDRLKNPVKSSDFLRVM